MSGLAAQAAGFKALISALNQQRCYIRAADAPELEQSFGACLLEGEERLHNLAHSSARRLRMIARSDLLDKSDVCPFGGWERRPPAGGKIEIGGRSIAVLASTND